jgi:ribonuclease P protein component
VNKRFRLKKSADFQRVRRLGKAIAHPFVVLLYLPNQSEHIRIGVAAGKSVGNAVVRNRAKRILRAAIRAQIPNIKTGYDCILIARTPIQKTDSTKLQAVLARLLARANLLIKNT